MKQYDKIYIPVNQMANKGVYLIASSKTITEPLLVFNSPLGHNEWLEEHQGKIVLTLEELKELWNHCVKCQVDQETEYANAINLNAYLQSKGISL